MNFGVVLPGLLLGCVALFIIAYCLRLILSAWLPADFGGSIDQRRLARKQRALQTARAHLENGDYPAAYPLVQRALYLERVRSEDMINKVHDHHMTILESFLSLDKNEGLRLSNLPVLEELVQTRTAALQAYWEAQASRSRARRKSGSALPKWASQEFAKKQAELREKLAVNRRSIYSELSKLFENLDQASRPSEVTYH